MGSLQKNIDYLHTKLTANKTTEFHRTSMILIMPTFSYTLLKHTSDGSGAWDTSTESIEWCYLYKDSITTSCGGVDGDVVVCVVHGDHCR